MAEDDPQQQGTLQVAATASNGVDADLICQRLAEAGIQATTQRSIGGPEWGVSGGQYIYVEAEHLDHAREILAAPSDISDEELAQMAEDGAPTQQTKPKGIDPKTGEPVEIPVPKRSTWDRLLRRAEDQSPNED
jgi:hypothetical protein